MKKFVSIILTAVLLTTFCSMQVFAVNINKNITNKERVLESIGVYTDDDDMSSGDDYISRETMAVIFSGFINRQRINSGNGVNSVFLDVDNTAWSAYAIETVTKNGWMSGYKDYTFRPQSNAVIGDAAQAIVSMLGYNVYISDNQEHNNGYYKQAMELGLFKGIDNLSKDRLITKGELTSMLINAMSIDVIETTFDSGKFTAKKKSESYIETYFDVVNYSGKVQAADKTAVIGEELTGKNSVRISGKLIDTTENMNPYVGYYVNTWCIKDNGEYSLLYFEVDKSRTNEIFIDNEDIDRLENSNKLFYYQGKTRKSATLDENISVIYNGTLKPFWSGDTFKPTEGNVKLVDSDNNGRYETAVIESRIDYIVKSAVYNNGKLTIKDSRKGIDDFVLDMDEIECEFYFENEKCDYRKIKAETSISVVSNGIIGVDATDCIIYISDKYTEGNVTSYNKADKTVTISSTEYKLSGYFVDTIYPSKNYKCYITYFGKIISVSTIRNYSYGFIKNAYKSEGDEEYYLKLFCENENFEVIKIAKAVKIDGVSRKNDAILAFLADASNEYFMETGTSMTNKSGYEQLIRYRKNSQGEISEIDTLVKNAEDKADEQLRFFANTGKTISMSTYAGNVFFDNYRKSVGTRADMLHFVLPNDSNNTAQYTIQPITTISGQTTQNEVCFFDVDEVGCAEVAIQIGLVQSMVSDQECSNIMVVDKVKYVYDESAGDDCIIELDGYIIKKHKRIQLKLYNKDAEANIEPKCGDIITFNKNSIGYATLIRKVFSIDNSGDLINLSNITTPQNKEDRLSVATIKYIDDGYWKLLYKSDSDEWDETTITTSIEDLLLLDTESKTVTEIGTNDLNEDDKVFILSRYNRPVSVVVYR